MSTLRKLGLGQATYDRFPHVDMAGYAAQCYRGWDDIVAQLRKGLEKKGSSVVLAVECYSGILDEEVAAALKNQLRPAAFHSTEQEVFKSPEQIDDLAAPYLGGDDPIFGFLTRLEMKDFLDEEKVMALRSRIEGSSGLTVVYGPGALLVCEPDLAVYADMARWEAQMRQRADKVSNLGVENRTLKASLQYKRSYFVDWRVCDKLKRATFKAWDYVLDTCQEGDPKLVTAEAYFAGLHEASRRPFRVVPFFDPGVWGGQWMREVCGLPDGPPNYAWCFDCVPEENSLLLRFGEVLFETPSINLVFLHPDELLGKPVHGRFGAEFPIRFDFLDTMQGQNLSFQVHPLVDYSREHFGLSYTQDESYYILDAEPGAEVYLGLKEDVDPVAMIADLETAQSDPGLPFPDEKHVARWPAKRHDHFLIPAGTCHCSGAGSMVLEISHTPYIFTFKLWDWARLDLNGLPRPINLKRGQAVIDWTRREDWCRENLINQFIPVDAGKSWREERTGLYKSEFIETRRHWFEGTVLHDTRGDSVNVLNLVEGAEAIVESPLGAFEPYVVHFAETFIVPASVGPYTVRPHGPSEGQTCATVKAFIRVNP